MEGDASPELPELPGLWARIWLILGFFVVSLLIYGKSLGNDFVRLDDGLLIFENPMIQHINPTTLKTIFTSYDPELYIPLTFLTYQIDYQIGGIHAFVYHLENLVWHTLNAILVMWLVFMVAGARGANRTAGAVLSDRWVGWVAIIVGLLFLVHPLNTEAVSWAAARKDVLATFFFLGSIIAYVYHRSAHETPHAASLHRWYLLSLSLFFLGLLAKVVILTLPVVLLLIDDYMGRRWSWRMVRDKIPYVALSILFGIVALFGKRELLSTVSPFQEALVALKSIIFCIQKLVLPYGFTILYPYTKPVILFSPDFFVPILLDLGLIFLAFWSRKKHRLIFFGILFYLLSLAPTFTNLIKGDVELGSDRYAYIPQIGLLFLLVMLVSQWVAVQPRSRERPALGIAGMILCVLAVLAYQQSLIWHNTQSLMEHVLAFYPNSYAAHNNLGNVYRRQGKDADAETELKAALAIKNYPKIRANLGALYTKEQKFTEAEEQFRQAMADDPTKAEYVFGLANLYVAMGKREEALAAFAKAITIDPTYAFTYVNRGALYQAEGDTDHAEADYRKAIQVEPALGQAHYNLAVLLEENGKKDDAKSEYLESISLQPDAIKYRINLGLLLANGFGDRQGSRAQFEEILKIEPGNSTALKAIEQLGN